MKAPDVIDVKPPVGETALQRTLRLQALSRRCAEAERDYRAAERAEDEALRLYENGRASFGYYEAAGKKTREAWTAYKARLDECEAALAETASGRARLVEVENGIGAQLARLSRGEQP